MYRGRIDFSSLARRVSKLSSIAKQVNEKLCSKQIHSYMSFVWRFDVFFEGSAPAMAVTVKGATISMYISIPVLFLPFHRPFCKFLSWRLAAATDCLIMMVYHYLHSHRV